MAETHDPQVYAYLNSLLSVLYLQWGIVWAFVAWYYGLSSYASWRGGGGTIGSIVQDVAAPYVWAFRDAARRLGLGSSRPVGDSDHIPSKYQAGNQMRFAIFLGSLTPVLFGFYFVEFQRSDWTWTEITVNLVGVMISILAGLSHLFVAYRASPARWRATAIGSVLWWVLAPPLVTFFL